MLPASANFDNLTAALMPTVLEAGRIEMRYFNAGVDVERKADKSPVTIADREAEALITAALTRLEPGIPVIGEEAASDGLLPKAADTFFLVDALDGTRLFVKQKPEFTINIALISGGSPLYGLIYAPAKSMLYVTRADGTSASLAIAPEDRWDSTSITALGWHTLRSRAANVGQIVALNSSSAGDATKHMLVRLGATEMASMGSSLKFCQLAAGLADVYVRLGDTNEWDTAAGQAILEAAGGCVVGADGSTFSYGHVDRHYLNPWFIAVGDPALLRTSLIVQQVSAVGVTAN